MHTLTKAIFGSLLVVGVAVFATGPSSLADEHTLRARAIIQGPPGSPIEGIVTFTQKLDESGFPEPTVRIDAKVEGLQPGPHGIHIHEVGSCADTTVAFGGALGHFDPGPFGNSGPDVNHPFHMGDIPNLDVKQNTKGHLEHTTSRITLSPGPLSVFDGNGSAVVVHLNPDQGITGAVGSGVSGGPRVACGVIEPL
jgi:Cu-Zn family superoxide dismutase